MTPVRLVARHMRDHCLKLVTAESCTAGLIAAMLGDVPGAGELLDSAFIVYSPEAKVRCLHVRKETLQKHNLTSEPVAIEMALGALAQADANLAISNTGVVDATDPRIAPGTQCFAWAFDTGAQAPVVFSETRRFSGNRRKIREASARYALAQVLRYHKLAARPS